MPTSRTLILLSIACLPIGVSAGEPPDPGRLEQEAATIGEIVLARADVFDLDNPEENKALYRGANRLHIITREGTIRKQLLFESGETYSQQRVEETERLLRRNKYLYDAEIVPVRYENGVVDLAVRTRDIWSLSPEISLSRKGGENHTRLGLEESNLLGRGQNLRYIYDSDVDRTENRFEFFDHHLGTGWVSVFLRHSNNSDGHEERFDIARPFFALDTRWAAGTTGLDRDSREAIYSLGEEAAEFRHEQQYFAAWGGWSRGLRDDRVTRFTAGFVRDDNQFSAPVDPVVPALLPEDRRLIYPYVGVELVENDFETSKNRDQIGKHEDFQMGTRFSANVGWSETALGADRDALVWNAAFSRGFGSMEQTALLMSAAFAGRRESGHSANVLLTLDTHFYHRQSKKRVLFASLSGAAGQALDLDNLVELGGDQGLRGYPLRYQTGESKMLFTIEQRYYTDWYPWRLFRVGGAIFADVGRVWGPSPVGESRQGWLKDVGFGFRFPLTRISSTKVVHLDLAFPLDGDESIDDMQILLEAKSGF